MTAGRHETRHSGPQLAAARCPSTAVPAQVPAILSDTERELGRCLAVEPDNVAVLNQPGLLPPEG